MLSMGEFLWLNKCLYGRIQEKGGFCLKVEGVEDKSAKVTQPSAFEVRFSLLVPSYGQKLFEPPLKMFQEK